MIDRGRGTPVVLLPGIQGRWEWMTPAIDALARRFRVLTFSLCDEPTSGFGFNPASGFGAYVDQIAEALQRRNLSKALVVGSSYGGLIATEFAARHPDRVLGLGLVSAVPPGWKPEPRHRLFMRAPRLMSPLFFLLSARMLPELRTALDFNSRVRFLLGSASLAIQAPLSPVRMARRATWLDTYEFADPGAVRAPALVITGEDGLDRVMRPELTRQYLTCLPHATLATLEGTGHLGLVTKPQKFAALIARFAEEITQGDHGDRGDDPISSNSRSSRVDDAKRIPA